MASFVAAMNAPSLTKAGVKGSDVYTEEGVGDRRVALFQMLVRKCDESYIVDQVQKAFKECADKPDVLHDYAVMAFQTRDVRGGKGERDVFYAFLLALFQVRPESVKPLVNLIPEYGCWKDCWKLWVKVEPYTFCAAVRSAITDLAKWIYFEDHSKVDSGKGNVSLLGKWLPREDSKYDAVAKALAAAFYPEITDPNDQLRAYRKGCSKLNAHLKTTEVNMCGGTWAAIAPGAVPGRLLSKVRKAFLNEILERKGKPRRSMAEGLRYPDRPDRMKCRQNFLNHTAKALKGEVTVKGADVVYPYELVSKYLHYSHTSTDEDDMIEAQWRAIRDAAAAQGGLSRAVAMSDFSGSMEGTPMQVSMALGILISELTHPAFRGYFMGFDSKPSWIHVGEKGSLKEKVNHAKKYAQGLSTNFEAAYKLILKRLVEHNVPPEDAPQDLIVLTDMGFDAACGGASNDYTIYGHHDKFHQMKTPWATHIDIIRAKFTEAGYTAPRIVLWNLRAAYTDFHAKADTEGVVVLSGWSPAVLKAITSGKVTVKTPYDGLRELLDAPRYDAVRAAWGPAPV